MFLCYSANLSISLTLDDATSNIVLKSKNLTDIEILNSILFKTILINKSCLKDLTLLTNLEE